MLENIPHEMLYYLIQEKKSPNKTTQLALTPLFTSL
jgi:hypothetical protein